MCTALRGPECFLGGPNSLENIRTVLLLNLVAHDVTGFGSGDSHVLDAEISRLMPRFRYPSAKLQSLLFFYLVVFSRLGNAPARIPVTFVSESKYACTKP